MKNEIRMNELKPCPFCNREPDLLNQHGEGWKVKCVCWFCSCNPQTYFFKRGEEAVEAWNKRRIDE